MSMIIKISDVRINRIMEQPAEKIVAVWYQLIDQDGNDFGEERSIIYFEDMPMDVNLETGEETRPEGTDHWFDMPAKYKRQMKKRAKDEKEFLLGMINS